MKKTALGILALVAAAYSACPDIVLPYDFLTIPSGNRASLASNFSELANRGNACQDSVDEIRARFEGYSGSLRMKSKENLHLQMDEDGSAANARTVIENTTKDSVFRVSEDKSWRFFGLGLAPSLYASDSVVSAMMRAGIFIGSIRGDTANFSRASADTMEAVVLGANKAVADTLIVQDTAAILGGISIARATATGRVTARSQALDTLILDRSNPDVILTRGGANKLSTPDTISSPSGRFVNMAIGPAVPARALHVQVNDVANPYLARFQNIGSTSSSYLDIGIGYPGQNDDYAMFSRNGTFIFGIDAGNRLEIEQITQIASNKAIQSLANANNRVNIYNASGQFDLGYSSDLRFLSGSTVVGSLNSVGDFNWLQKITSPDSIRGANIRSTGTIRADGIISTPDSVVAATVRTTSNVTVGGSVGSVGKITTPDSIRGGSVHATGTSTVDGKTILKGAVEYTATTTYVSSNTVALGPTHHYILYQNTTGTLTLNLPDADAAPGREYVIRIMAFLSDAARISIASSSDIHLEGNSLAPAGVLELPHSSTSGVVWYGVTIFSDGFSWSVVSTISGGVP